MIPSSSATDFDRSSFAGQLRELMVGLRHYLEDEKTGGFEGWVQSPRPKNPAPPLNPTRNPKPLASPPLSTLEEVREWLGDCRRCKLHAHRKTIVFGTGNPKARLVFVGEGPGRDEDLQGKPFVGAAGQLLTKIIQAIQLTREEVYIANIIKCRPPENRNPQPDEIAACEPFLQEQLKVIQPRLICALGNFAAQTLLKTEQKITSLRGRFHVYQGILLMPTFHPAFLLRNPDSKRDVWEDMKKIKLEYEKL
jgi:uracil-DNA glycosylase